MLNNQRGSVTALALVVMLFFGIIAAGLAPMLNTEVSIATKNRDVLEAQYAAEAGAKRAVIEFFKINSALVPDLTWLNSSHPLTDSVNAKSYSVTVTPGFTNSNTTQSYTITSEGKVGKATKTVSVKIDVTGGSTGGRTGGSSVFSKYSGFSGDTLQINSGSTVNGDVAANGALNLTSSTKVINGTAYTYTGAGIPKKNAWGDDWNYNAANAYAQLTSTETLDVAGMIPVMPNMSANGTNLATVSGSTLSSGSYYSSGSYLLATPYTVNGTTVIYINGDLKLSQTGNKKGTTQGSLTGGTDVTIYVNGNVLMDNSSSIAVSTTAGSLKIYATGSFTMTNNASIVGKSVTIQAGGTITLGSQSSINKDVTNAITKINSKSSIQLTNNFTLQGTGLVVAKYYLN